MLDLIAQEVKDVCGESIIAVENENMKKEEEEDPEGYQMTVDCNCIAYVEEAIKDEQMIGSDWCEKYVTPTQDNNHQINNTRNWIKFKKLLNQLTFPDSITAVMYVALHIHKYYILFDKQIWKRYGMTGNDKSQEKTILLKISSLKLTNLKNQLLLKSFLNLTLSTFIFILGISCKFDKEKDQSTFNICAPYPAKVIQNPDYSKIQYFLDFLKDVASHETEDLYHWFLKYLAHICRYKNTKTKVSLIFFSSGEGTGKSLLQDIIANLVGEHNTSRANGSLKDICGDRIAHLAGKKLILVNEVQEKKTDYSSMVEKLKSIITDTTMTVRPLYQEAYTVSNTLELIISTNNANILSINHKSRRFTVMNFTVMKFSDIHKQDNAYFAPLYKMKEDQEFLDTLYTYLVNEIDVMENSIEPLKTDAFYEIADASANSISKYFKELLERDADSLMVDRFDHKKDYLEIPLSALYSMYKDWCVNTGHNRMQSSNIVSYIKDGNIDKVVFKIVKVNRLIRVTV